MDYPSAGTVLIRNASVPAALTRGLPPLSDVHRLDILVADGRIASLSPAGSTSSEGAAEHDLDGGLVLPAFVDVHTHVDKGHVWPRRPNPDGTWLSALLAVQADREANWATVDVKRRMDFSLRCAYAYGTAALRTHLDAIPPHHEILWALFEEMREHWASRIELQAVSLVSPDVMLDPATLDLVARRTKAAGGILGGALIEHPQSREAMRALVDKAGEFGLDLDVHVDESSNPESSALRHLADAINETGYKGKALAGHCCVLTVQDKATVAATMEAVAQAGIAIVSLPMCNLYLQDRDVGGAATPLRRGVTLLKEFKAAGIPVAIASDNTRDPFYAYGDLDCLEVLREGARILHFDHPKETAWNWARTVGADAADIAGFAYRGEIEAGASADLLLFRARNWTELLSRPQSDRIVLRGGRAIDTALPDYRELDDLME